MKILYCDEPGTTGQNLADLSQPVFTLASTTLLASEEARRLLARFDVMNQKELK